MPKNKIVNPRQFDRRSPKQTRGVAFFQKQPKYHPFQPEPVATMPQILITEHEFKQIIKQIENHREDQSFNITTRYTTTAIDPLLESILRIGLSVRIPGVVVASMLLFTLLSIAKGDCTSNHDSPCMFKGSLPQSVGKNENNNISFKPVHEIFVDKLPESTVDLDIIHSICKTPVVYRGAGKHWEAMNWTPEFMKGRRLTNRETTLKAERLTIRQEVIFSKTGKKTYTDGGASSLFEALHYHEKNIHTDCSEKEMTLLKASTNYKPRQGEKSRVYTSYIVFGTQGFVQEFHTHVPSLLAEFYGERMVFLAPPDTNFELINQLNDESNKVIDNIYSQEKKSLLNTNTVSNGYFPFQKVILKPGDILFIPGDWYHKVHYLTHCVGSAQFVDIAAVGQLIRP